MGLWVRAHATVKNMGSMGDSDAEKGGLLSLTYASPPEWDCPLRGTVIDWNSIPLHIKEIEDKDKFKAAVAQYFSQ